MTQHRPVRWAGAMAAFLALPAAASDHVLVVNSFGGAYEDAHRRLVIAPFEARYGVRVEVVTVYSADALALLRGQRDNPQFDVIHFSGGQEVIAAREGLLEPIRPDQLSHYDDLYPIAVEGLAEGRGPVYSIAALGLLYDADAIPTPTSWRDLWRPDYAQRLVLTDISNTYGLLALLMLNRLEGGTLEDIGPGLAAIAELAREGLIVRTSPELQTAFAQQGAWIAPYAQDYAHTLREAGLPVGFVQPEEGSSAIFITANVVAGRPNVDLAKAFVDFSLRPEAQIGWAEALRYSPTNGAVELPPGLAAEVLYGEEAVANLIAFDPVAVNEHRDDWTAAWRVLIGE